MPIAIIMAAFGYWNLHLSHQKDGDLIADGYRVELQFYVGQVARPSPNNIILVHPPSRLTRFHNTLYCLDHLDDSGT